MHNPNLSQAVSVVDLARRMNLSAQKLQKLIDRGYLADLFQAAATVPHFDQLPRCQLRTTYGLLQRLPEHNLTYLGELNIPAGTSLAELVCQGKFYGNPRHLDLIHQQIAITRHGPRRLYVIRFDHPVPTDDVACIGAYYDPKRLALVEDLLAVDMHPDFQEQAKLLKLVQLGSSIMVDDARRIPCLGRPSANGRRLDLGYYNRTWPADSQFLLVEYLPETSVA